MFSLNILETIWPKNPFQAQPPDRSQTNQLLLPSKIQYFRPRAHGHNQRHGAGPYKTCVTTLCAYAACGIAPSWLCFTRRLYSSSIGAYMELGTSRRSVRAMRDFTPPVTTVVTFTLPKYCQSLFQSQRGCTWYTRRELVRLSSTH